MTKIKVFYKTDEEEGLLSTYEANIVPQVGDKMFIYDDLYKVTGVFQIIVPVIGDEDEFASTLLHVEITVKEIDILGE